MGKKKIKEKSVLVFQEDLMKFLRSSGIGAIEFLNYVCILIPWIAVKNTNLHQDAVVVVDDFYENMKCHLKRIIESDECC